MNNMWKSGIMGVVVGDALGCPVQFESKAQVAEAPVKTMIGYRTFDMPPGTWTDDSALTIALLESITRMGAINERDIMDNFVKWLDAGEFTPYGFAFDIGRGTRQSIIRYRAHKNPYKCGGNTARDNGNGSIMRIMPAVLFCIDKGLNAAMSVDTIHKVSALTHAHVRAQIACGLYYFMAKAIVTCTGSLTDRLQIGLDHGFAYYETYGYDRGELGQYGRTRNLQIFKEQPEDAIRTTGYVVDTFEAAVWGLINTDSFDKALLRLVNLGGDTDSIAAVAGGLAGLYYGYNAIPAPWLEVIQRRGWIEDMIKPLDDGLLHADE